MDQHRLRLSTFNCRSIKNSMSEVYILCHCSDFVFIQEHWLLPTELDTLSHMHRDFYGVGHSAVDVSKDILVGRPYGGTGILYRNL